MEPITEEKNNQTSPNLKKQFKSGDVFDNNSYANWTKENILAGLQKFYEEKGRYPTAHEIDAYEHLPSSRQIQRAFGGLIKLRQDLGLKIAHYGIGASRSSIAKTINARSRLLEKEIEDILISKFGEYFVHIEKPLFKYSIKSNTTRDNKFRADFFVYSEGDYQFCVGVFYAESITNLTNIVNIKALKYNNLIIDSFLVNMNEKISQDRINSLIKNKRSHLDTKIKVLNKNDFIIFLNTLQPLKAL